MAVIEQIDLAKSELLEQLEWTRKRTETLVCSLPETALDVPYHPGVNPPLWEMGHAAFFYEVFVFNRNYQQNARSPANASKRRYRISFYSR